MDGGPEVGGLSYEPEGYAYVLRFTPIGYEDEQLYDIEAVRDEFLNQFDTYLITEELKPKIHFHIYLETSLKHEALKQKCRDFIYPYYPVRNRGFGTKQYSCLEAENPLNAIIYALKQRGTTYWSGFTEEFIQKCQAASFEKKPTDFEDDLKVLTDEFLTTDEDPYTFSSKVAILYSQYDKRVHMKDIQGYVNSKLIKRDPKEALRLVKKNLTF